MKNAPMLKEEGYSVTILDDLCVCEYDTEKLSREIAVAVVEFRLRTEGNKKLYIFSDIRKVKTVPKDARDYFSQGRAVENVQATAFWGNSVYIKLTFNFFMTFSRPSVPVKLFTNKEEALTWLRSIGMKNTSYN